MENYNNVLNEYTVALESYNSFYMTLNSEAVMEASTDNQKGSGGTSNDSGVSDVPLEKDISIKQPTEDVTMNDKELNPKNDEKKNRISLQGIKDKLNTILKKIWGIIVRLSDQLSDIIKRAMVTNKKFDMVYKSYKGKYKPAALIKVITYPYDRIDLLKKINDNFINAIKKMCNDYKVAVTSNTEIENSMITMSKETLQQEIMKLLDAPSNVKSIEENYVLMKDRIRGKKVEVVIKSGDIPTYEKAFYGAMDFTSEGNKRLKECKDSIHIIKQSNTAIGAITNKSTSDLYSKAIRYLSNINLMYTTYVTYSKIEFLIRSEYSFTGRIVLKRMYRMP